MQTSRKALRFAWLVIPVALGAGTLYWVLAPGLFEPGREARTTSSKDAPIKGPRVNEALGLLRDSSGQGSLALIDAYRDWASDPQAVGARRLLLGGLFKEQNVPTKLSSVLAAIEADPTPAEQDPLWEYLVSGLSDTWEGETATKGMDLMFAETRPRARRALIASFAHLANSERWKELTPEQGQKLTNYFMELHKGLPKGLKSEVEQALQKVAGKDVVEILNGRGLGENDQVLDSERAYQKAQTDTARAVARP